MKIKFRDRLILFLGAVMSIVSGAVLFVAGLQIHGLFAEGSAPWIRAVCIVCGVLLVVFGGYLFYFPRRLNADHKDFVVQKTESGELRIAVKAIENLVQKCIDLHDEIHVISMKIINTREGVVVDLYVSLANNISIPMAVASLQRQIKQYLVASSGIEVKEVRVSVESTQDEPEIEQIAEEEEKEEVEAVQTAEPKPPLHQRLFGRREQAANMPQAPQEAESALDNTENDAGAFARPAEENSLFPADEGDAQEEETNAQEDTSSQETEEPKDE